MGYGGPKLWNTLPRELKTCTIINTFKKLLKTFLFKEAYLQYLGGVSGPVVRALDSGSDGPGSSPGWGTTLWP